MTIQPNKSIAVTAVLTGSVGLGTSAAASVDTDTPTNAVKVLEAGAEGARITRVDTSFRASTVASRVTLLRGSDAAGTTKKPIRSRDVTAWTYHVTTNPGTAAPDFGYSDTSPLLLGPGESLWAIQTVAQAASAIVVNAEGGKYQAAP